MPDSWNALLRLPFSCRTLVDVLRYRSANQPEQKAFTFLEDGETEAASLTYQELDRQSRAIASQLQALNLSGERALLLYPAGLEYLAAFFGCLYGNVIAVPLYPPKLKRNLGIIEAIASDAGATIALTTNRILSNLEAIFEQAPGLKSLQWLATDTFNDDFSDSWQQSALQPDSLAYLQYTSGSTSTPKGVMISHENVLYNVAYIDRDFAHTSDSVAVTWLPHFHDMGLVDGLLKPVCKGISCYFMPPTAFVQKPIRWLQAISRYRGTHSGGPNFAYDLCVRKIKSEERANLDLSSWCVAYNGAEPIDKAVLEQFANAFEPCGFRWDAFSPAYGMAEATLKISTVGKENAPILCAVDIAELEKNRIVETSENSSEARVLIGCGTPEFETKVLIVNPETLKQCAADEVGEIWVASPSVARGYWNRQEETENTFQAYIKNTGEGPFLRTGDLGFFHQGELFITGRLKDMVIIRGRNLYPQDIEKIVERSHPALRPSAGAAFGVEVGGEEQLVVVQELELRQTANIEEVIAAIREAIAAEFEVQTYAIALIKYGSIPKTTSGKIQRRACKVKFIDRTLDIIVSSILEGFDAVEEENYLNRQILSSTELSERQSILEKYLQFQVAQLLNIGVDSIGLQQSLNSLGLDSLKVFELKNQIETDFSVVLSIIDLFDNVNICCLATIILEQITTDTPVIPAIQPITRDSELPLSFAQERLWFLDQLEPGNPFYNLAAEVRMEGHLNVDAIAKSLNEIIKRHEILRTKFVNNGGKTTQVILKQVDFRLPIIDLSILTDLERECEVENICLKETRSAFELTKGNLFRATLLRLSETEHILLLIVHHIVFDGWSFGILIEELKTFYQALNASNSCLFPPLSIQYADFAAWQRQQVQTQSLEAELKYWKQQLGGNLPILNLPTDFPRPSIQTYRGARQSFVICKDLSKALTELSQREGTTLFMTLLAAFKTLLYRYTGEEDIVLGSPIANRNKQEIENIIGFFVNTLVLRTNLSGNPSFRELLSRVREVALSAYAHQSLPFEKLVEALQPERDLSYSPLFQVSFALQNNLTQTLELPELKFSFKEIDTKTAKFDLTLFLEETEQGLIGTFEYNTDLFRDSTIARNISHFQTLLEGIIANPDASLSDLPLLTSTEINQLLFEWNNTQIGYPQEKCLHQLIEAQVERTPDAIAVVFETEHLTYRQLNQKANQLANYLQKLGLKREALVAIYLERSLEMAIALLGILKAGAAYVPLDPAYPQERIAFMLQDTQASVLLTQQKLSADLPATTAQVICLDTNWHLIERESADNLSTDVNSSNLAYVIYTSGSTGKPKGVQICHRSLINFITSMQQQVQISSLDNLLSVTTITFDIAALEIFLPLTIGACVEVASREVASDGRQLSEKLTNSATTIIQATPATWRMLLAAEWQGNKQLKILCGGEALPRQLANQLLERCHSLWNLYGPTETTIWSTIHPVKIEEEIVAIGRPIANTEVYILDSHLQPVPVGVAGELHIGGDGLARGYLNRPELTAEKFIHNPFSHKPDARLYKTGDLGRYLPDGKIEYIGRIDHQVKIRGFRIELGEIESLLARHPAVKQAVVVAREDRPGERRLVAYIVSNRETLQASSLREFLKDKLPEYMLPSAFVMLESLPLTLNGKIDRKQLPLPDANRPELDAVYLAPRTSGEKLLADIWAQVLGIERVGINDNFFELGGHSLLATQIIAKVREEFQVNLPLRSLFKFPTIAGLIEEISHHKKVQVAGEILPAIAPNIAERNQPFLLTDIQQAYWVGRSSAFELGNIATHVYVEIESIDLDIPRFNKAWQRLIDRHEMLRSIILPNGQQQILPQVPNYEIKVLDLREKSDEAVNFQLEMVRDRLSHQVLPSDKWPLFEVCASQLDNNRTKIHFSFDLLIADAWSFQIIGKELADLYRNPELTFPPLEISFRDYVLAEVSCRNSEQYRRSQDYWHNRIPTLPPPPELPLAQNPSAIKNPRFVRRSGRLEADTWLRLKTYATKAGITPSALLLAAFAEVLSVWSKTPRFTLTLTLFNRLPLHSQVNELVGDFTSLTLLAVDNSGLDRFADRVRRLQEQLWEDLDYRYVSGVQVLRELAKNQGRLSGALMPIVFTSTLTQDALGEQKFPLDWLGKMTYGITQTPQVFLDHQVAEEAGALVFNWDAVEELFPAGLLDDMFAAYSNFLQHLAATESAWQQIYPQLIPQLQIEQRTSINATDAPIPTELLHTLFTSQVPLHAEKAAVITSERSLTYEELYRRSHQLGYKLRQLGAQPNQLVAVVMEKGWEQIVGVLGILISGAAYVPIDPKLPQERRSHLLEQAEVQLIVTQSWIDRSLDWPENIQRICVDTEEINEKNFKLESVQKPEDIAYVIYTSGSTGLPKGVTIDHQGAVNTIVDINQRFNVRSSDRVFALSSLSFDLSVYDIFGTLAAGGTIVIPDASATQEPAHWAELIQREKITVWNSVPPLMQMMVDYADSNSEVFQHLRLVLLSGDWLPLNLPNQIKSLVETVQIISLGGATEASIWSILYPIESVNPNWKSIPYGKPMKNQRFYVLNQFLEPCPVWVPGQLYIGGIGLAKCYWRDEEKTAASFITHPRTGEKLYRTGDLGRYLPDGNIEFLGREDFQVKIGGYRIELGEIEAALLKHSAVREVVVSAVGEANKRLVAYVVTDEAIAPEHLREFLLEKLPSYMIPAAFVMLDILPLTANGKVNRKALPIPNFVKENDSAIAPRTDVEETVAKLWRQILDIQQVSIHDNFFDLGGDSIKVTQFITKVRELFRVELPLRELFEQPTIAAFSQRIEQAKNSRPQIEDLEIVPVARQARRMKLSSK